MKKLLQILFISIYLISSTELQELVKLPVLFQHYFEHKNLDNSITFFSYMAHHYSDRPNADADADRDSQLPFKAHSFCAVNVSEPGLPPSFSAMPKKAYRILPRQKILVNDEHIPYSTFAGKIWQPPKAVS